MIHFMQIKSEAPDIYGMKPMMIEENTVKYFTQEFFLSSLISCEGNTKEIAEEKVGIDPTETNEKIKTKSKRIKRRRSNDKILDNKYNRGEIDYEEYSEPKIDPSFRMGRLNDSYDSYDHYRMISLNNTILEVYKDTIWHKTYDRNKRIPKQELSEIYHFIKEKIIDDSYTKTEMFVTIAQFLDVNMSILYTMVGPAYKEELIEELRKYKPKLIEDKIAPLF